MSRGTEPTHYPQNHQPTIDREEPTKAVKVHKPTGAETGPAIETADPDDEEEEGD
jgi:hypothetical protein